MKNGEVCLFFGSELLKMTYRQTTSASKDFLEMALDTYLDSYFERLKKPSIFSGHQDTHQELFLKLTTYCL